MLAPVRTKVLLMLIGLVTVVTAGLAAYCLLMPPRPPAPQPAPAAPIEMSEPTPAPPPAEPIAPERPHPGPPSVSAAGHVPAPEAAPPPPTKAERLAQLRETFRGLAAGEPKIALQTAKQLTNEVERETALLALVTEWKHGELGPPRLRAAAIASLGLEAGLGLELAKDPELSQLWAAELGNSQTRSLALEQLAPVLLGADPASAFAFADQLSPADRRKFLDAGFASWAGKDTEAALQWADQLTDPAEKDAALKAIRGVVPVGIGAELRQQDGYAVINKLFPGSPAELGGQLQAGDRIVAVAQGNNVFVDARGMAMQDLVQAIRGAPGTMVQLQVLAADAPADATPRTIAVVRGQLKVKR